MFKKISAFFSKAPAKTAPAELPKLTLDRNAQAVEPEVATAICVLLIYLASSDEEIASEESEAIFSLLEFNLQLSPELIPNVVQKAVVSRREKGSAEGFIALINNVYSIEQRVRILAMAWKLILSDNKVEKPEERMLVRFSSMMFITLDQQDKARAWAEEGLV